MALAQPTPRDPATLGHLREVSRRWPVAAADRRLPVDGLLGDLLPGRGVQRGAVVAVDGVPGAGATSVVLSLCAAATDAGEWAAMVDLAGTLGGRAAEEAGVALDRFAVVRRPPLDRWATVVAALLDGFTLVAAAVPPRLRPGDARRLLARARERAAVLVALGPWPVEAAVRLHAERARWEGLTPGGGLLAARDLQVRVEGRGTRPRGLRARVG